MNWTVLRWHNMPPKSFFPSPLVNSLTRFYILPAINRKKKTKNHIDETALNRQTILEAKISKSQTQGAKNSRYKRRV